MPNSEANCKTAKLQNCKTAKLQNLILVPIPEILRLADHLAKLLSQPFPVACPDLKPLLLLHQFDVTVVNRRIKEPVFIGFNHSTSFLIGMAAIRIPALLRKFINGRKQTICLESVIKGNPKFPHAGCINDQAAIWEPEKITRGRHMHPFIGGVYLKVRSALGC